MRKQSTRNIKFGVRIIISYSNVDISCNALKDMFNFVLNHNWSDDVIDRFIICFYVYFMFISKVYLLVSDKENLITHICYITSGSAQPEIHDVLIYSKNESCSFSYPCLYSLIISLILNKIPNL